MILVTGASGNVGKEVVRLLQERSVPFRIGARRADRSDAVKLDFLDTSTYAPALTGCRAVFLLRPPAVANTKQTLNVFLDVARSQGVAQVVFVSVAGAGDNPIVPHHAVEQHLRTGSGQWTILRPGFFAQNLGDAYRRDIVEDQRIYVPAGAGRVAFIDVRDVAAVAVAALVDPAPHHGQTYTLTGPAAVTFDQVAADLSAELGRTIRYVPASVLGYPAHLRRRGLPWGQVIVQTILHVGLRSGQAEAVDPTLTALLDRPPYTIQDYIRDHRQLWAAPEPTT
jgi:uncharacterized protein YbjT (DUF2867 family)